MIILRHKQGSDAWKTARAQIGRTASEASAMMGESKTISRSELMRMKATGQEKEFSAWVQKNLLDKGHTIEAASRPIAEKLIGEELYQITATSNDSYLIASLDGYAEESKVCWECKSWNEAKAADVRSGKIPAEDFWQVVQHLVVTRGVYAIYMLSDGAEKNEHVVYGLVSEDEEKLMAGWAQWDKDFAAYVPPILVAEAVAAPITDLPAVVYEINGLALTSNIAEAYRPAVLAQIAAYAKTPVTDQDFVDLDAFNKGARLSVAKSKLIRETVNGKFFDKDKFDRDLMELEGLLTQAAITGEKVYAAENENRKNDIRTTGRAAYSDHVASLQTEIKGVALIIPAPDWIKAGKGLKTLKSLQGSIDDCLANAKIAADAIAKEYRAKLAWYAENAEGKSRLFTDLQKLIEKPTEDFINTIKLRLAEADKAEAERLVAQEAEIVRKVEAERERIRAEEVAKLAAKISEDLRGKTADTTQAEQSATAHLQVTAVSTPPNPEELRAAVVEHQDEVAQFLREREMPEQLRNTVRAYLIEFVRFQASRASRKAA